MIHLPPLDAGKVWTHPKPAIIRPAEHSLLRLGAFRPCSREERRVIVANLIRSKHLTAEEVKRAMFLVPVVGWASKPAVATYISKNYNSSSSSPTTFTSQTLGTAYPYIVVAVGSWSGDGATVSHTAVKVAGTSATNITDGTTTAVASRSYITTSLWIVANSSATGDIVVSTSARSLGLNIAWWGVQNLKSTTALKVAAATGTTSALNLGLTGASSSGFVIAAGQIWNGNGTSQFTGDFTSKDYTDSSQAAGLYFDGLHGTPASSSVTLGYQLANQFISGVSVALR